MNEIFYDDEVFRQSEMYQNFIRENPLTGCLKIRATSANEAVPIENINIRISKQINGYKIIFFEGKTDTSGMINNIILPAPNETENDEIIPLFTTYDIEAIYSPNNFKANYKVSIIPNVCLIQYINIVPGSGEMIRNGY